MVLAMSVPVLFRAVYHDRAYRRSHYLLVSTTLALAISCCPFAVATRASISLTSSLSSQAKVDQGVRSLSQGDQVTGEIDEGQAHIFRLPVQQGDFVHLRIEQRRVELTVSLEDPLHTKFADGVPMGFSGEKRITFVAERPGDYLLTLRPLRNETPRASYKLSCIEWRRAAPRDEIAISAERLYAEAEALNRTFSSDSTRQAIEKYDAVVPLWHEAEERFAEAFTLLKTGLALHNLSRFKEAIDRYSRALPVFEEIKEERGAAQTLTNLGWSYAGLGQLQRAIDYYGRSLEIRRSLNEPRSIAQTLNLLAEAFNVTGEPQKAIDSYLEALPLAQAAGDQAIEAYALNGLGWVYIKTGERQRALDTAERALPLWRKTGNRRGEAQTLHLRGTVYGQWLYADQALESFEQARSIWKEVGNRYGEGQTLNNIGVLYQNMSDFERAKDYYLRALEVWRAIGNRNQEAVALNNLGLVEWHLDHPQQSLDYLRKALELQRVSGDPAAQATSLENLGEVLVGTDNAQALEYLGQALKIAHEIGSKDLESFVDNDLGFVYEMLGDEQLAVELYSRAVSLRSNRNAQINLATIERKRGNLARARELLERSLEEFEGKRSRIPASQARVLYSQSNRTLYEAYADVLMRLHDRAVAAGQPANQLLTSALEASEKGHARNLLETLNEAHADIRRGVDSALLDEERAVQDRLNARETRRTALLNAASSDARVTQVEKEIQDLAWQLEDVRARIRTHSPAFAALTQPAPLKIDEIQSLLDQDTILLEYLLAEDRSYLWAVTPTAIAGYYLPGKREIEPSVRRLYELISKPGEANPATPTKSEYQEISSRLSHLLLGPVADKLGKKRLLIVSDGVLEYLPFAALPAPSPSNLTQQNGAGVSSGPNVTKPHHPSPGRRLNPRATSAPLISQHEIINLPSASVLGVVRREHEELKPAPKTLAILADPVFSRDDSRVSSSIPAHHARKGPPQAAATDSHRKEGPIVDAAASEAGVAAFERLRFSRLEAESITALVPEKDTLKALDFAASRATAEGPELAEYRIVHFATHGLLNSRHPELSGLVLSLLDEKGQPRNGFLRLHEIYNLRLNADLVVLSACQTALGKEARGEGLIGLTRGFMYAGASRVVASLWRVDDRATAELMKRFYQGMLSERLRPAAALRAAQVSMLREKRFVAPHNWAAFVIQGEWR